MADGLDHADRYESLVRWLQLTFVTRCTREECCRHLGRSPGIGTSKAGTAVNSEAER